MEKQLGRYLNPVEVVHHINHIRTDNRIENLMLIKNGGEHTHIHRPPLSLEEKKIRQREASKKYRIAHREECRQACRDYYYRRKQSQSLI